ncbi:MAG: (Fe-S)-binding protein [Promethearchaeota archaeon]
MLSNQKSREELGLKYYEQIIHRCFRCGYCKFTGDFIDINCPSYKKFRFESFSTGGRMWLIYGLMSNEVEWSDYLSKILYACTTCGNCGENCKLLSRKLGSEFIVDIIEFARAEAFKIGFCSEKAINFGNHTAIEHNPYFEKHEDRLSWLPDEFKNPIDPEIGYFVGCTSSYREKELARNTFEVLKKIGVKFSIFEEEWCCGSPLLRTGQRETAINQAKHNIELFRNKNIKTVITSCAGCYRTIKEDYSRIFYDEMLENKLPFEVLHISEYIKRLLDENTIEFKKSFNEKTIVTYHDPCHLGRHAGLYDEPREIIKKIPGIDLKEMRKIKGDAMCCGAGGGVKTGFSDWALEMAGNRIEEALHTGAKILITTCPFCEHNFVDAIKENNYDIQVMDLVYFLKEIL